MADLIDKQSVLEIAMCYCPDDDESCSKAGHDIREMLDEIEALPAIEPEMRHGQWSEMYCYKEYGIEMADYECTNCGGEITKQRGDTPKYCEHCGADMREGAENEP